MVEICFLKSFLFYGQSIYGVFKTVTSATNILPLFLLHYKSQDAITLKFIPMFSAQLLLSKRFPSIATR